MEASKYFSERHRRSFECEGFLMVKQVFDPHYMGRVRAWVDEVQARTETPGEEMKYFEDSISGPAKRLLDRIENIVPYHEGLAGLINGEA